jgi:glycoprotein endo-alpha-1,2-mannosidase
VVDHLRVFDQVGFFVALVVGFVLPKVTMQIDTALSIRSARGESRGHARTASSQPRVPTLERLWVAVLGAVLCLTCADLAGAAPLVGAYYYPWYGTFTGGHSWTQTLREHLVPQQPPALGYYNSRSSATIEGQIDESHRGNISFWATSWWGPGSAEDITIRNNILTDPRAGELKYAVQYESTGRLGSFANPTYSNLLPDFQYLAQNYFNNPNYYRINNRPVVFLYLTRAYFNTQAGQSAVANLRQSMTSQFGVNPYLIGDDVFPGQNNAQRAGLWDAITDFDVYGSALQAYGSTTTAVSALANQFQSAKQMAQSVNVGFIPSVSPGFNDSAVRSGHTAAPRYLTDVPGAPEGSLFSAELNQAVLPNLDPTTGNMLMVSTFNEWHEDTQIEPTIVANSTTQDSSGTGLYTQGNSYSGYGNLYLDQLRVATVPEPATIVLAGIGVLSLLTCVRQRSRFQCDSRRARAGNLGAAERRLMHQFNRSDSG